MADRLKCKLSEQDIKLSKQDNMLLKQDIKLCEQDINCPNTTLSCPNKILFWLDNLKKIKLVCPFPGKKNVLTDMYAQRRLKSACASAQSDQSLRRPYQESLHPWLSKVSPVKILIRLCVCVCVRACVRACVRVCMCCIHSSTPWKKARLMFFFFFFFFFVCFFFLSLMEEQ